MYHIVDIVATIQISGRISLAEWIDVVKPPSTARRSIPDGEIHIHTVRVAVPMRFFRSTPLRYYFTWKVGIFDICRVCWFVPSWVLGGVSFAGSLKNPRFKPRFCYVRRGSGMAYP